MYTIRKQIRRKCLEGENLKERNQTKKMLIHTHVYTGRFHKFQNKAFH